jgi:hypothetical protein
MHVYYYRMKNGKIKRVFISHESHGAEKIEPASRKPTAPGI